MPSMMILVQIKYILVEIIKSRRKKESERILEGEEKEICARIHNLTMLLHTEIQHYLGITTEIKINFRHNVVKSAGSSLDVHPIASIGLFTCLYINLFVHTYT